ncbi:HpaII family restriction endonuclease [Bacteroides reticulotermitis]|uniref:HpaII family restriction endonuclease n=1 Tax=Bacteroides reticulotermitis TaxID=1133319 RepID=UPI003A8A30EE
MAFEATKREWCELYTFLRLLAEGKVALGTAQGKKDDVYWPIAMIQREEHDGTRRYYIENESIRIVGETMEQTISREDFGVVAGLILQAVKSSSENDVSSPDGVEEFLNEAGIYDLEAKTEDRTDFSVAFWHSEAPLRGFCVRSRLGTMNPLLDGGRAANLKLEQSGAKFATPAVSKINALPESPNEVSERMMLIERLGGVLKYSDVADRVFRCNLSMIDLHFPRMLTEMVRIMHLDGISRISELTEIIKQMNPLKLKDELINKHSFYEFKMKEFLMALALGMRPAKIYTGEDSAVEGLLLVDGSGEVLCYHKSEKKVMEDFLFLNTRLEKGSVDKDKYGFLERENGVYYFKLNAKIALVKR